MFTTTDLKWFSVAGVMLAVGFSCMALDPVENGFGVLTLHLAPPLLLAGFMAFVPGLAGRELLCRAWHSVRSDAARWLTGSLIFLASLSLYLFTLEPTASLWDCSEFIASAYKLQVPHTPGNPLLLLIGRIFSMFSLADVGRVAVAINAMSAVFSALTVVIIYLIILRLARRAKSGSPFALHVSAVGGSLCFAFSDTFWFSAVEAETYAASCFFFFLLVYLVLWGSSLQGTLRNRLQILIFYLAGLSFCIHPMCVLAVPVLPVVWYLQNKRLSPSAFMIALFIGISIVLFINRVIAIGTFELAFALDKVLVNYFALPFYSGAVLMLSLLVLVTRVILKRYPRIAFYIHSMTFLLVGFLPYMILFIRSNHNPPIDESNPENLQLIKAYMNREGYPTRPLIYGPYFDAEVISVSSKRPVFHKDDDGYKLSGHLSEYEYQPGRQTILPRIYSTEPDHIASYRNWTGLKEGKAPGFIENMTFMLRYQLGHMYLRYLLFNFSGRAGDEQNSPALFAWSDAATHPEFTSKARNQYWMIPLAFGIAGLLLQLKKDPKGFIGIAMTFLLTGALLVIYLNSTPNEPRERDYIYVGSYGAFAIWIGLGFYGLTTLHRRATQAAPLVLLVPALMVFQNFDDHDRSGRTFQVDNARNILNSCAPDSILFTGGDNDTFPLWYIQEVEGFRTDVRVMVLSYLNTDWYINQLRNRYYESEPFRLTLTEEDYRQYGPNDALYVRGQLNHGIDASKFLALLHEKHPGLRVEMMDGGFYHSLPSKQLIVPARKNDGRTGSAESVGIDVTGRYLYKNGLAILDIMLNNPDRPMYFNFTSMSQTGLDLEKYLAQEGNVFRFVPARDVDPVNTQVSYRNLVTNANYDNLLDENIFFSYEDHELRIIHPLRQSFNALAFELIEKRENKKAGEVLDVALKYFYPSHFKPSFANLQIANLLVNLGRRDEAERMARSLYAYNDHRIKNGNDGDAERQLRHFAGEMLSELAED